LSDKVIRVLYLILISKLHRGLTNIFLQFLQLRTRLLYQYQNH